MKSFIDIAVSRQHHDKTLLTKALSLKNKKINVIKCTAI